jgi:hypothetical protein
MYDDLVKRLREDAADGYLIYTRSGDDIAEAADAIEELSKRVDESIPNADAEIIIAEVAKPRWISVTEALPSVEKEVYVTDGEYIARANLLDEVFPGDKPCWSYSGLGEITHWCMQIPLPEPPKEERA